ncbi:MAG: cytochrome [Hydrocarboniphaga sp.]|uniref:cytochrome P450 n=1 Tax=Hydrocarboniphaga sp. TaxID=2033016 RepID=UPI0026147F0C|nr:cytochrome P450 [Hydrocarboniphaga sp.]MDB5972339.1 cytochrome [Hydrocarboniphaga sp.]
MSMGQTREWKGTGLTIPAHVPDEAVHDFDFYFTKERDSNAAFDVYDAYQELQKNAPEIFYSPRYGGHWVVTRYEHLEAIYSDHEHFYSRNNMIPPAPEGGFAFLNYDGAKHAAFRSILQPFFSPKAVAQFEPVIRQVANSLIDEIIDKGHCEFVSEFAKKMPTLVVMKFILQLPEEDTPYLIKFVDDVAHAGDDMKAFMDAFQQLAGYVATRVIPARRANPGSDVLSKIIHSRPEGREILEQEILGAVSVLIVGGLDTVVGALGIAAKHLAQNPDQLRRLVENPQLVPAAADEMLRRFAIVNHARTVAKDIEFKGRHFAAGDMVLLPTTATGIDDRRFENASEVDFGRTNNRKNLTFANGPHFCLGTFVARSEMAIFLSEWTRRIPEFQIKQGATLKLLSGITNHLESLPLVWKAPG